MQNSDYGGTVWKLGILEGLSNKNYQLAKPNSATCALLFPWNKAFTLIAHFSVKKGQEEIFCADFDVRCTGTPEFWDLTHQTPSSLVTSSGFHLLGVVWVASTNKDRLFEHIAESGQSSRDVND